MFTFATIFHFAQKGDYNDVIIFHFSNIISGKLRMLEARATLCLEANGKLNFTFFTTQSIP
jgi:hypothetical protein